jgi:hypothetical protein
MLYTTTLLRIFEDYKLNNKIHNLGIDSIKEYIIDTCDFDHNDWKIIKELYSKILLVYFHKMMRSMMMYAVTDLEKMVLCMFCLRASAHIQ